MKYTGQKEEQVGEWEKMKTSLLDTFSLKCLSDNQGERQHRSWINVWSPGLKPRRDI